MKISIFSFAVNDKFPIDIAHRYFIKHVKDEFEYILFNDASEAQMERKLNIIASYNKIKSVRVPQHIHSVHNPSACYSNTLNWAVRDYAVKNDCEIIFLLHSDIFPVQDVSISNIIENNMITSTAEARVVPEKTIIYLYPAFTMINMKLLPNVHELDFGLTPGLDVGAKTIPFIEKYQSSIKFVHNHQMINMLNAGSLDNSPYLEYFKTDLTICKDHGLNAGWIAEGFYHYMAGSQWNGANPIFAAGHSKRMELFLKYFY
jgi:hypothetical protein